MDITTGVILAGGVSRRLGYRDKALLEIRGRSVIEYVIEALSRVTENTCLITNSPEKYAPLDLPMFGDILPGSGSLGGIYTGLKVSKTHHSLVIACDMPFVNEALVHLLLQGTTGFDMVAPRLNGYWEPLLTVYHKRLLPLIENQLRNGQRKVSSFFRDARIRTIREQIDEDNYLVNTHQIADKIIALEIALSVSE